MSAAQQRIQNLSTLVQVTKGNAALGVLTLQNVGSLSSEHGLGVSSDAQAEFSKRINGLLRPCDQILTLSDDRICVVFDELLDDNHALLAGLKVERAFEEPFMYQDMSLNLEIKAGLVYFGKQERLGSLQPEELYRFAETAREHAVENNTCFEVSNEEVFEQMQRDWECNRALGTALEAHEVTLDYQPKYRLADGAFVGAEAIIRWRKGGVVIPPQDFLPILNNSKLWDLTLYTLRRAIREMREHEVKVPIAVNIPPAALEHSSFLTTLRNEMSIWDVDPKRLALEITEAHSVNHETAALLNTIRAMGVTVIIDEFGAGNVSLERFRDLPADEIKIDRSFISDIAENNEDQHITETIIDLAHRFSKTVVADGVEDAETFSYLADTGCDVGQGFYLSAPLNNSQFAQLLAEIG